MISKVRMGVIGTRFGGQVQIPCYQENPDTEVIAVCSASHERAVEVARLFDIPHVYTDYRELVRLPELDAVTITTPPHLHYPMVLAALAAGKHVLCDKPFALTVREAREMAELARSTGVVAMTNFEWRFAPGHVRAKELLQEKFIGEPMLVNVSMLRRLFPRDGPRPYGWRQQLAMGGGSIGDAGTHLLDVVRFLLGEFRGVTARLHTVIPEHTDDKGQARTSDTDDTFHVSFMLQSGVPGALVGSNAAFGGSGSRIEIYGSHGTLVVPTLGDARAPHLLGARFGDDGIHPLPIPDRLLASSDGPDVVTGLFAELVRQLVKAVRGEAEPSPSFEDGLRSQEVLDAIRLSDKEGRWLSLDDSH